MSTSTHFFSVPPVKFLDNASIDHDRFLPIRQSSNVLQFDAVAGAVHWLSEQRCQFGGKVGEGKQLTADICVPTDRNVRSHTVICC